MTLKTIIIDDEIEAIETLEFLINNYCENVEIVGKASRADDAIELINNLNPDLVFLDIEMPQKSGFDLIDSIGDFEFSLVFITAYNQYAIKAFELSALDYLLKPVPIDRLQKTIERVIKRKGVFQSNTVKELSSQIQNKDLNQIAIPYKNRHVFVKFQNIIGIEAKQAYSSIICIDKTGRLKTYTYSKNLSFFENLLSDNTNFFRCHRSWIINLNHVESLNKKTFEAVTNNKLEIPISRRKIKSFSDKL